MVDVVMVEGRSVAPAVGRFGVDVKTVRKWRTGSSPKAPTGSSAGPVARPARSRGHLR